MIRRLYDWVLGLANHPHALWALAVVAFLESSVFPIPPDVLMIPMILARPRRAWLIALVCTVASVAGALLGYWIGAALFDSLPVWQNVAFRLLRGSLQKPRDEARAIAIDKLRRVGLKPDVADRFPAELSGGMQKRVGLARAIAADPEIIFFDEPTTGLDPIMAGVINELIREIVTEMGATAMTITHDMTSVRAIADRVAMLHDGVIQWTGPVSQLDSSGDAYVDQFISGRAEGPIEAVR